MNPYLVDRKRGESYIGISIEYQMRPNKDQEKWLASMGNKVRGAYNLLVETYVKGKDYKDIIRKNKDTQKEVYQLLVKTEWLKDVPSDFILGVRDSFFVALDNFRKHKFKIPKFKKKTQLLSLTSNSSSIGKTIKFEWDEDCFYLYATILNRAGVSSRFKTILHKSFEGGLVKNMSINRKSNGKWYVSFSFDVSNIMDLHQPVSSTEKVGIDVGIKDMAITSDGKKFQVNLTQIKKLEDKISQIDRVLARKRRLNGKNFKSRNYNDSLKRKGRLQEKINQLRKQTHRYVTTVLTNGDYGVINIEDLKLAFMLKNKHLARATARIGIRSFTTNLKTVASSKGILVNDINPKNTSKTCSTCGHVKERLKLSERKWECESCGEIHDRDINAAKNIRNSLEITK
jgi:putative transposase